MRPTGILAVVTGTLVLLSACSDGGGTPPSDNTPPVADFAMPACTINVACQFSSASSDDVEVTEWSWDFDGDGSPEANTASAWFTYKTAGEFQVSLTVVDGEGLSNTKTSRITIAPPDQENEPPVAGFSYTCEAATCAFTSTSTDAAPGTIVTHAWDFGDGNSAVVANPSHTYIITAPTDFTVTLTVTDDEGATGVATRTVSVTPPAQPNTPPTADFSHICDAATCAFTSSSTDQAPGTIVAHAWDFGDGASSAEANPSHTYSVTGPTDFTVTLTVTDNEGATGTTTRTVSVAPAVGGNTPPTASFTYSCEATTCAFSSTSTDAAPGSIVTYAWNFGDGFKASEANPTHTYGVTAPRDFTVTLTVTDNEGATGAASQTVSVTPPAPVPAGCYVSGTRIDCYLDVLARSKAKLKLLGVSCDLKKQRITVPQGDQVFLNVCSRAAGDSTFIFGGPNDEAVIFEPGSQVRLRFNQGTADAGQPAPAPPAARVEGAFPRWTIYFEDGDNAGSPGEPDFTDVVLGVEAIAVP